MNVGRFEGVAVVGTWVGVRVGCTVGRQEGFKVGRLGDCEGWEVGC